MDDVVPLAAGPAADTVTLTPGQQSGTFSAAAGPLATPSLGTPTYAVFGGQNVQTAGSNLSFQSDSFFAVDVSKAYALSGWARSGDEFGERFDAGNRQSFGFASYDVDMLPILPENVLRFTGATDTTLAAALKPGDTKVFLANGAGWSNAAGAAAATRGLAWYGYHDSTGTTYADYTYTRNVAMGGGSGLWTAGSVSGNVITLATPWTGPQLPAGTAVRDTGAGDDANFVAIKNQAVPGEWTWTQYANTFGGGSLQNGNYSASLFRPGTSFIKAAIVANQQGTTSNFISWRDVSLTEVPAGTTAAALALPIIDLSIVSSGDQRHALALQPGAAATSAASLVRVNTSQSYTLVARAMNVSDSDERPMGFASYDVDKKLIHPLDVTKYALATDTTLTAALMPGATSFLVTNVSGWSNDAWGTADTRSLAWYGYTDSTGHTYANYTYTRNVAFDLETGLWAPGAIHYDAGAGAYRVTLLKPWSGPTIAAGAAIRNAASGDLYNRPRVTPDISTLQRWTDYAAVVGGGVWQNGEPVDESFRPGTAYIQPIYDNTTMWADAVIAAVGNAVGTIPLEVTGTHQVAVDLDVLAKAAAGPIVGTVPGDYNLNGVVDAADYTVWRDQQGATGLVPYSGADGNGDGKVDSSDYQVWRGNFGHTPILIIDSVVAPIHGTATILTGAGPQGRDVIHYRSDPWFVGTEVVTYTLRNTATNQKLTTSATIHVLGGNVDQNSALAATLATQGQVVAGNVAPTTADDLLYSAVAGKTMVVDGVHTFGVLGNDTDPTDTLVARLVSGPAHGSLSLKYDGTFDYTPAVGFVGADSFRYEAYDGRFTTSAVAWIGVYASDERLALIRLANLAQGVLNYNTVNNRFPLTTNASYFDASGNPYLSWRVFVLPSLGNAYQSLFAQFHLNEPWNSVNNLPLVDKMPDIFREPGDSATATTTRFQIISGEGTQYYWRRVGGLLVGPRNNDFTDGASNSLLVVETGASRAITWTKPDNIDFNPANPFASLGSISPAAIHATTADGTTITLPATIDPATFGNLVTVAGGEVVDANTLRRQYAAANGGTAAIQSFGASKGDSYFKTIDLAMQTYASVKTNFPVASSGIFDVNGNPYLSWRVYILPYLGQANLFNQFHLNEPWDSPNNLPLLSQMPDFFRSAGDSAASTSTRVMTFTGPEAPFGYREAGTNQIGPKPTDFTDGTSNTVLFAEAGADKVAPWTKPDDLPFDVQNPLAAVGDLSAGAIRTALADGSLMRISSDISAALFAVLVTRSASQTYGTAAVPDAELGDAVTIADRELRRAGRLGAPLTEVSKFKQIVLAMHTYADTHGSYFPITNVASYFGADGFPLVSWRVHILPYLGFTNLYNRFHRNEPWDSPNNLALLDEMPDVFRTVGDPWDSVTTRVEEFTGPGTAFLSFPSGNQTGLPFALFTDGTSQTILLTEAGSGNGVPWTKPFDVPYHSNNPFSALGDIGPNSVTAFADGHTITQPATTSISTLDAEITRNGRENNTNPPPVTTVQGVYVHQTDGDTVTNEYGADTFDVVLDKDPMGTMVVNLGISDSSVATLNKSTLTFTSANWNLPQRVILRGVDNHVVNADQVVTVTVGGQVFSATIRDDDAQPILAGDYNRNGVVDAADYTVWRDTLGSMSDLRADGDGNGTVEMADYGVWTNHFGQVLPAAGSGGAAIAVEELAETVTPARAAVVTLWGNDAPSKPPDDFGTLSRVEPGASGRLEAAVTNAATTTFHDRALLIWLASRAGQDRGAAGEVPSSLWLDGDVGQASFAAGDGCDSVDRVFDAIGAFNLLAV